MKPLYNVNGLMFWTEREIRLRRQFEQHFEAEIKTALLEQNSAWSFIQVEAPLLTPRVEINSNYTSEDVFETWLSATKNDTTRLVLRPETTPGSYRYAVNLLQSHSKVKPPFVVWQTGKSFRREQDQVVKNMRLKEFYQQEFQCIYTADTANDYHANILNPVKIMIEEMVRLPTRIVKSDRLPSYSEITMDVEVNNGDKWMEVCSISRRTDFPEKIKFTQKKKQIEQGLLVLEIAIGLDRLVYNFGKAGFSI